MSLITLILLILCHFISGYGLLSFFSIRMRATSIIALSLLLGVAIDSFVPFLLQLFYIQLTDVLVFISMAVVAVLLNIRNLRGIAKKKVYLPIPIREFRIELYEVPYILVLLFLIFVSVWRCYYFPPISRDMLSGPEAIAEYAFREHTLINSFFQVDLLSTNNQFKSPFLIDLQLIYKLAGFPFGQLWLSVIFVSFTVLFYQLLKTRVHPVIAGALLLIFTITPEVYAYTFIILYDYSNMVYFFLGLFFLLDYFNTGEKSLFWLSLKLLGIATWIRSETLVLVLLFLPPLLLYLYRTKEKPLKIAYTAGLFVLPSLVMYFLQVNVYIKHYLPVHYDVSGLINPHLLELGPLFNRYGDMLGTLMTGTLSVQLFGHILLIFVVLFAADLLFYRRFSRETKNWLYAIFIVFLGIGFLGFLLPLYDLMDTTKRAIFKLLPLMVMYLASNGWIQRLSNMLSRKKS